MNARTAALWLACTLASATVLVWSGRAAHAASDALRSSLRSLAHQHALAQDIARVRATIPSRGEPPRPASELAARVTAALTSAGLGPANLAGFGAEPARRDPRAGLRVQRATATLGGVTLPQLGRFLDAWSRAEPAWIVMSIDLTPGAAPTGGGDVPLRAVIGLECVTADAKTGDPR